MRSEDSTLKTSFCSNFFICQYERCVQFLSEPLRRGIPESSYIQSMHRHKVLCRKRNSPEDAFSPQMSILITCCQQRHMMELQGLLLGKQRTSMSRCTFRSRMRLDLLSLSAYRFSQQHRTLSFQVRICGYLSSQVLQTYHPTFQVL